MPHTKKNSAMNTTFYIILHMRKGETFEPFGRFFIGNDREAAGQLFGALQGSEAKEKDILHLDLMETVDGLPVNLKVIACNLGQLTENCRIITKEVFKLMNMEEKIE
jgi:hypothetical protein